MNPHRERMLHYIVPHEGALHSSSHVMTLKGWLTAMNTWSVPMPIKKLVPPAYWYRMKEATGINPGGISTIWFRNYHRDKQLITWASAPEEDFIAAGYAREEFARPETTVYQLWLAAQEKQ